MIEKDDDKPRLNTTIFKQWKEYEDVAMHFNDLILRLRTQALGGVAAIGAIVGVLMKELPSETRWLALTIAFGILCLFWVAIWVLDFGYYNRLLLGAVQAILDIEKASGTQDAALPPINLSTQIRRAVENRQDRGVRPIREWRRSLSGPTVFYALVLIGLLAVFIISCSRAALSTCHRT